MWGGRKLLDLYGKPLPAGLTIGESWEISDRPGDVSVITHGPFAGKDLHWLVEHQGNELLGNLPGRLRSVANVARRDDHAAFFQQLFGLVLM